MFYVIFDMLEVLLNWGNLLLIFLKFKLVVVLDCLHIFGIFQVLNEFPLDFFDYLFFFFQLVTKILFLSLVLFLITQQLGYLNLSL